jgi:pimeloyl-ACP methyl ester carboxylesterase
LFAGILNLQQKYYTSLMSSSEQRVVGLAKGVALAAATLLIACGSKAPPPGPTPYAPPPASAIVEEGAVTVRREVFVLRGVDEPSTPDEHDAVRVVRYRTEPAEPARAIVLLMPGFLGGAGSFEPLARAIVRASKPGDALEAWAIDRRSNLLEDHHGLDVAEVRQDPEVALRYYVDGEPVEGRTFEGFVTQGALPFAAEWGLETTIGDLRAIVEAVPADARRARVFLVGHSLGATIAEEYAAWDFDGEPGYAGLAGLALVDGVARSEGAAAPPLTKDDYVEGGSGDPGGFGSTSLSAIQGGTRYVALPLLGTKVYPTASITAMRALLSPDAVVEDVNRDSLFRTLLALPSVPKMTNRAAMGFAFDDTSNGLSFAAVSCGKGTGGAIESYEGLFGSTLVHPSDPAATYGWVEFDATSPKEHTDLDDLARSWHEGPGLDFAEWYFPARLPLDASAASTLVLEEGAWPLDNYRLRAIHGRTMDLPIFAAVAGLVGDVKEIDPLRALVDAVPIGPGRPLAGKPRSEPDAFRVLDVTMLTHIDPLSGTAASAEVSTFHAALTSFVRANSPPGGVDVTLESLR